LQLQLLGQRLLHPRWLVIRSLYFRGRCFVASSESQYEYPWPDKFWQNIEEYKRLMSGSVLNFSSIVVLQMNPGQKAKGGLQKVGRNAQMVWARAA